MTPQTEFLVARYADWLIDRYNRGAEPIAYVFNPEKGGDVEANEALLQAIQGYPIAARMCDRTEWA